LAKSLCLIDEFIAAIIPGPRIAFGILILHDTAQCFQHCLRCEIFRGNKIDKMLLPFFFLKRRSVLDTGFAEGPQDDGISTKFSALTRFRMA
jgi:hypothetical protein